MYRRIVFILILAVFIFGGCTSSIKPQPSKPLNNMRFWAYQIQDQDKPGVIQKYVDSRYDMVVLDDVRTLKGQENYNNKKDILRLEGSQNSLGGRKIVLCYLNVGEAESYRTYWQEGWAINNPEWIVAKDPGGWDGNYPVKFWRDEWKNIVKSSIDRIIEDGYDGMYLDWLEVYSFIPIAQDARDEGLFVNDEIIRFASEMTQYARAKKPGFLVVVQNTSELGDVFVYNKMFDAISQEGVFVDSSGNRTFRGKAGDVLVSSDDSKELVSNLKKWQASGKPVFNVEYGEKPANVRLAYDLGEKYGFKTYVTLQQLDAPSKTPPVGEE